MDLAKFGWNCFSKSGEADNQEQIGRVTKVFRTHYTIVSTQGEIDGLLSKRNLKAWKNSAQMPCVGDWVVFSDIEEVANQNPKAFITEVLPRKSKLSRLKPGEQSIEQVIAANVDIAFIVSSINNDYNINRIQRYVLIAENGFVRPVLILSKIDLNPNYEEQLQELKSKFPQLEVLATTTTEPESINQLKQLLSPGQTCVFVGSSGVGKSSIVNAILGENQQDTGDIRLDDDKGRHTTTSRSLFPMDNGALLIDTPGMREVQVLGDEIVGQEAFEKIEELATQCKFSNCEHKTEPKCAILAALDEGIIEQKEFVQYKKLKGEMKYSHQRLEEKQFLQRKKKSKRY